MHPDENLQINEFEVPLGWDAIVECDDKGEAISLCRELIRGSKQARYSANGESFTVWVMRCPVWPPIEAFFHKQTIQKNQ